MALARPFVGIACIVFLGREGRKFMKADKRVDRVWYNVLSHIRRVLTLKLLSNDVDTMLDRGETRNKSQWVHTY